MKKVIAIIGCAVAGSIIISAHAREYQVRDFVYTVPVIGSAASSTNAQTFTLRGLVSSIYVDFTTGCTGTVTITSDQGTIFSKSSIGADTQYRPRVAGQTTAGADITVAEVGSTVTGVTSNNVTAPFFEPIAVAGEVTVKVVGETATVTNNAVVTLFISQKK